MGNSITELITQEPRFTALFHKVLSFCSEGKTFTELNEKIMSYPEMETPVQSVNTILEWLEGCGALEVHAPDNRDRTWTTTDEAIDFMLEYNPASRLEHMLREEDSEIIKGLLSECRKGKKLAELEAGFPQKNNNPMVNYYILLLERAGALEWKDGWMTTDEGRAFLEASA